MLSDVRSTVRWRSYVVLVYGRHFCIRMGVLVYFKWTDPTSGTIVAAYSSFKPENVNTYTFIEYIYVRAKEGPLKGSRDQ